MKLRTASLALAGAVALAACSDVDSPTSPAGDVRANVAAASQASDRHFVFFKNQNKVPADFAKRVAALGGTVVSSHPVAGAAIVSGLSESSSARLAASNDVQSVEQDFAFRLDLKAVNAEITLDDLLASADVSATVTPAVNTAHYGKRQWNYPAIGADLVWGAKMQGSSSIKVAILDTGIDYTFPDLTTLVDHARSASFIPGDVAIGNALFGGVDYLGQPLKPYMDLQGHGTHVASTVASRGVYVAGMTKETRLMAVKVLGANGGSAGSSVFQGFLYAIEQGADVINMSLGGTFLRAGGGGIGIVNRLMAIAKQAGVTVVVAAGNDGTDLQHNASAYNAYCDAPHVICVSATGPVESGATGAINDPTKWTGPFSNVDVPAIYTTYGKGAISVAAPGGNYALTEKGALKSAGWVWQACSKRSLNYNADPAFTGPELARYSKNVCSANPTFHLPNGFVGTSQAAPHVAGLAAMLVLELGRNPVAIRHRIEQTADDLAGTPNNSYYGRGRVNAARALGVIN